MIIEMVHVVYDHGGGAYSVVCDLRTEDGELMASVPYAVDTASDDHAPVHRDLRARLAAGDLAALVQPPPAKPPPMAGDVKSEAQRRIVALVGSSDLQSCIIKQLNMLMRGVELANKRATGVVLTAGETAEADALQAAADAIKAIRVRSNEIEALSPIPDDYADNARWA